jgi:DUF438 domain-containing protein
VGGDLGFLTAIRLVPGSSSRRLQTRRPTADRSAAAGGVSLPTGALALEQLIAIFHASGGLTFVDADDRVAFFSEVRTGFSREAAPSSDAWFRTVILREAWM